MKVATLCYPVADGRVLLGMKKKGFGEGKWNGFGGKVQPGETIEQAAVRELAEESGLFAVPELLAKVARLSFAFGDIAMFDGHVYLASVWGGEPQETEEMRPQWFALTDLPWELMWPSDRFWLERALSGSPLRGVCRFDEEGETVERFELLDGLEV